MMFMDLQAGMMWGMIMKGCSTVTGWIRSFDRVVAVGLVTLATGFARAAGEYDLDGDPTAAEEEIRWLVNRGRFDRDAENRLRGTSYMDVPQRSGPLAPHRSLITSSRRHSEDMARKNLFQHDTVPGSAFYNPVTQPKPWDRMRAEGYSWNGAAENIAAGYGTPAAAYLGWWNSTGHRVGMFNAGLREIGVGIFVHPPSAYGRYYTMNLGHRRGHRFFTDTVFDDRNRNGVYDSGEGVPDVRILLRVRGRDLELWDQSGVAGGFAVPMGDVQAGTKVEVHLGNETGTTRTVTLPVGHSGSRLIVVRPGERVLCGTMAAPGEQNAGFRDLIRSAELQVVRLEPGQGVQLAWDGEAGARYRIWRSSNLVSWTVLKDQVIGVAGRQVQVVAEGEPSGFFRLEVVGSGPADGSVPGR
jgi:Cysteine-rich secretory protein family